MSRLAKQIIIFCMFLLLFSGLGYGTYSLFTENPTCSDNKQNQNEEGIDCGPVCGTLCSPESKPLEVISTRILSTKDQEYDFIAEIKNPNSVYGASDVSYQVIFYNASGQEVARRIGIFYITSGQNRFLIESAITSETIITTSQLLFAPFEWEKVEPTKTAIDFPLRREQYQTIRNDLHEFEGVIYNNSNFDLDRVDVVVLLVNDQGENVAVNSTVIRTLPAGAERYFKVSWPFIISSPVVRTRVIATTDVLNNSNFIKTHGTQEEFQNF